MAGHPAYAPLGGPFFLRPDLGAPQIHPDRRRQFAVVCAAADVVAGTSYVAGYFTGVDFMLAVGLTHLLVGGLHMAEAWFERATISGRP